VLRHCHALVQQNIDVVMSDDTRSKYFGKDSGKKTEPGTKAAEGAGIGAGLGGAVGAALAAIAAVGTSVAGVRPRSDDDARHIESRWREQAADPVHR
jgi:hypothetical protein